MQENSGQIGTGNWHSTEVQPWENNLIEQNRTRVVAEGNGAASIALAMVHFHWHTKHVGVRGRH